MGQFRERKLKLCLGDGNVFSRPHFVTFSCYHRKPLLASDLAKRNFESALERGRNVCGIYVYAYLLMPEHVHLLVSEPQKSEQASKLRKKKPWTPSGNAAVPDGSDTGA